MRVCVSGDIIKLLGKEIINQRQSFPPLFYSSLSIHSTDIILYDAPGKYAFCEFCGKISKSRFRLSRSVCQY